MRDRVAADRSVDLSLVRRSPRWVVPVASSGLAGLLMFQAWSYVYRLPLSLGPRVVLEPWLLRQGFILYEQIADLHTPLLPLILSALLPLFPDALTCAKATLVVLISLSTLLTFLMGRRTGGWLAGLWAAWFFVTWSPTIGFGKLWHETLLAPLYLLLLLVYDPAAPRRPAWSSLLAGLLGGTAVLVKQHAAAVLAALVLWNAFTSWRSRRSIPVVLRDAVLLVVAALLPVLALAIGLRARAGTLTGFWHWTVTYGLTSGYRSMAALGPDLPQVGMVVSSCLLLPAAILCLADLKRRGSALWLRLAWGLTVLVASSLTAYPRFHLFHLQAALPVLAWLSSMTLAHALHRENAGRLFATGTALALSGFWLVTAGAAYRPALNVNQPRPIWEYSTLVPLADEVRDAVGASSRVYIYPNDEATANLYYLLRCLPPRFWVFDYTWYAEARIQAKVVHALQEDPPDWVIRLPGGLDAPGEASEIAQYLQEHYRRETRLRWEQGEVWLLRRTF